VCILSRSSDGPGVWRVVLNADDMEARDRGGGKYGHEGQDAWYNHYVQYHAGDVDWTDVGPFMERTLRTCPGLREELRATGRGEGSFAVFCITDIEPDILPVTDAVFATLVRNFKQVRPLM
jgi:hypothetical protein